MTLVSDTPSAFVAVTLIIAVLIVLCCWEPWKRG